MKRSRAMGMIFPLFLVTTLAQAATAASISVACPPKIVGNVPGRDGWRVEAAMTDLSQELTAVAIELTKQQTFHCFYKRPHYDGGHQLEIVREATPGFRKCTRVSSTSYQCTRG